MDSLKNLIGFTFVHHYNNSEYTKISHIKEAFQRKAVIHRILLNMQVFLISFVLLIVCCLINLKPNMKYFRLLSPTFLLIFLFLNTFSQNNPQKNPAQNNDKVGVVTGAIVNAASEKPVEYAYVVLFKTKDSSQVSGSMTNDKGKFILDKLAFGNYYLKINFIGLKPRVIKNIQVTPKSYVKNMGNIGLDSMMVNMKEVTINTTRSLVEFNLDKKVVNVEKNLSGIGGSAVDVMQNVPSVTVDVDGNLSLRGSSNVTILIDGKPSGLTGLSSNAILEQIPASSIQSIEIISNPSAKYDPDGMSGIVNIILKKKRDKGYNGLFSVNAGTGNKYNGSVNLNYRWDKVNIFANYDFRYNERKGWNDMNRQTFILTDTVPFMVQHGNSKMSGMSHNIKAGIDYFLNDKNNLTFSVLFNNGDDNHNDFSSTNNNDSLMQLVYGYKQTDKEKSDNRSTDYMLSYRKTFLKKGKELTSDLVYTDARGSEITDRNRQGFNNLMIIDSLPFLQKIYNDRHNQVGTLTIDYSEPFGKTKRIDAGYKGIIRSTNEDIVYKNFEYPEWLYDSTLSNNFLYDEQIHALYGIFANSYKKLQFQIGIRLEQAYRTANQRTSNQKVDYSKFSVFPSVHITQKLKNDNAIQLSYSRRVNRPSGHMLNPFVEVDPQTRRFGNPNLKPEYTDAFEVGYLKNWKKRSINVSLFYRNITDIIQRYSWIDSNLVTNMTPLNMSRGTAYGLEVIGSTDIYKWWKINGNFSYFRNEIKGKQNGEELTNSNYTWTAKVTSSMTILKNMDIQILFNYRAPMVTIQGTMQSMWNVDLGLKKDIMKNKAFISFRISDIFNTQKFNMDRQDAFFYQEMYRKRESRVAYIGFTYKINGGLKTKAKPKQNGDQQQPDDQEF
jgi:outer membrane receptor protein involved in Fe transport